MSDFTAMAELSDQLTDVILGALQGQIDPADVALALLQASFAIVIGSQINPDDLFSDLADIVLEMNTRQQRWLH